jgi:hypothetical protein
MLRSAWFLARKDVTIMLKQRETLLWTFLMPPLFFFFIGNVTGGFGGPPTGRTPLVVETAPLGGFLQDHLLTRLENVGFRIVLADTLTAPVNRTRLTVPDGFTDSVLAKTPVPITFQDPDGGSMGANYDKFRVQRAVLTVLTDIVVGAERGEELSPGGLARVAAMPRTLELEVSKAGRRRSIPTGFEQAVPGTMVMFTLLIMVTSGAVLLVIERRQGLLRRLASSPMSRTSVMLGKWGGRILLGAVQVAFAMFIGSLLFGMNWGPNVPMLLVVLLVYAGLVALVGIVLGNLARSEGQAVAIGVIAANVLGALGGCWWPIEITPPWMQGLAKALPTGWAMDALHKLVSFGDSPASVLPHLAVMLAASLAVGWLAVRTFRFQ